MDNLGNPPFGGLFAAIIIVFFLTIIFLYRDTVRKKAEQEKDLAEVAANNAMVDAFEYKWSRIMTMAEIAFDLSPDSPEAEPLLETLQELKPSYEQWKYVADYEGDWYDETTSTRKPNTLLRNHARIAVAKLLASSDDVVLRDVKPYRRWPKTFSSW